MRVVIVGCVCSYKSSVARKLSKLMKLPLYDTDKCIESLCEQSVADIIEQNGVDYFRKEEQLVATEMPSDNCIISCGGGLPTNDVAMQLISTDSIVVWLATKPETVFERLQASVNKRPLQDDMTLAELTAHITERNKYYSSYADVVVDTDNCTSSKLAHKVSRLISKKV